MSYTFSIDFKHVFDDPTIYQNNFKHSSSSKLCRQGAMSRLCRKTADEEKDEEEEWEVTIVTEKQERAKFAQNPWFVTYDKV